MSKVFANLGAVMKFLVALLGAVLVILQELDVIIPDNKWVGAAIAAVTAILVYLVPNTPAVPAPAPVAAYPPPKVGP